MIDLKCDNLRNNNVIQVQIRTTALCSLDRQDIKGFPSPVHKIDK